MGLLLYEAIREAASRGYERFDLNPSGGHTGVVDFKRRFAPRALPAPIVETRTRGYRLLDRLAGARLGVTRG
jgi:hypothetical protein